MWLRLAFLASAAILVSSQYVEPGNSEQVEDLILASENSARPNLVSAKEHHLFKHTRTHNPCALSHHCTSKQICKVVVNPALQFPVARCVDAFSPADANPPKSSDGGTFSACEDQKLSTGPMSCRTQSDWVQRAGRVCGTETMIHFNVVTQCLSFDPTPVYQFATFQCCSGKVPSSKTSSVPVKKKILPKVPEKKPAPEKKPSATPPTPEHKEVNTSPPVPTTVTKAPTTAPPSVQETMFVEKQNSHPSTAKPAAATRKAVEQDHQTMSQPKDLEPNTSPSPPKSSPNMPADVIVSVSDSEVNEEESQLDPRSEDDSNEYSRSEDGNEFGHHWAGIIPTSLGVVVAVAVIVAIAYRMRKRQQVIHRPRQELLGMKGATMTFASVAVVNDEDRFTGECDGLMFDDTEVQQFVNPSAAVFVNTSASNNEPAIIESTSIEDWELDSDALLPRTVTKKRVT